MIEFIAHKDQSIQEHLQNVSRLCGINASKIGLQKAGELLGLLHDIGKYSSKFQQYIGSSLGVINEDEDEFVESGMFKGKIDHSTAGAQLLWNLLKEKKNGYIGAQLLTLCLVSHHSGMIDCISPEGDDSFFRRIEKPDEKTHLNEVSGKADTEILERIQVLLQDEGLLNSIIETLRTIARKEKSQNSITAHLQSGLFARMLFSCLIDADRIDSADSEKPLEGKIRQKGEYISWDILIQRLEKKLNEFDSKLDRKKIDEFRKSISETCRNRGDDKQGVFTLTVPTGGGKTLASLRFALYHAKKHMLDRIIFVIPYTSIIDQNAQEVRNILEISEQEKGRIVLEHHSNLVPEVQNWKNKVLSESWDAPIIYTTSVQLLESLFGSGTRSVRRMHQLANSVIIFDEIQTLPVKTVHLFCNAMNYLTNHCKSTIVLCTATQPLLNKVDEGKGRIEFDVTNEIMVDVHSLFRDLKRVDVIDITKAGGWQIDELAQLTHHQVEDSESCLVIVNTKQNARLLYDSCKNNSDLPVYHLSTNLCPAHRLTILNEIKSQLSDHRPLICISTQLIEAGVDIDFGSVIRFQAGLDSIIQAAGRCNRHGKRPTGKVIVVNPAHETIDSLVDIKEGIVQSERIFRELKSPDSGLLHELIHPDIINRYFQYYFFERAKDMSYIVDGAREDTLLNMLSINGYARNEYKRTKGVFPKHIFCQSFMSAAEKFSVIDAPTRGVVVPYGEGEKIITDLFSQFAIERQFELLKRAQRFTVNVFPHELKKLQEENAVREVAEIGVLVLNKQYYHAYYGLSTSSITEMDFLNQ